MRIQNLRGLGRAGHRGPSRAPGGGDSRARKWAVGGARTSSRSWVVVGIALVLALPATVLATPHHAHWHYLIGARANAARTFATQLHHEATSAGTLHLEPARVNASDMARLAEEIVSWVDVLEAISSHEEREPIREFTKIMRSTAQEAAGQAALLLEWIDAELASRSDIADHGDVERAEARTRIATQTAALYHGFGNILRAHKDAELALGIPVPNPPPAKP